MLGFEGRDLRVVLNFFRAALRDKYLGSAFGGFWAIINPLMMLMIFTFVFGYVFKIRLPGAETTLSYAIWLIAGYGPWIAFNESVMAAALSVVSAPGLVKNLAFKTEVLPIVGALTGIVPLLVSLAFLVTLLVADSNPPTWHSALAIPLAALQVFLVVSLGFLLAALTVFFRDLGFALPNLLTVFLFLSPIFYPIASMPEVMQRVSTWNPLYVLCEAYRAVLTRHEFPDWAGLAYVLLMSCALGYITLRFFRRVKGYFDAAL